MHEKRKDKVNSEREVSAIVSEAEAQYLQNLGLKTLVTNKFQPIAKQFWTGLLKHKGYILITCLLLLVGILGAGFFYTAQELNKSDKQKAVVKAKNKKLLTALKERTVHVEFHNVDPELQPQQIERLATALMEESDMAQRFGSNESTILHFCANIGADMNTIAALVAKGADPNAQKNSSGPDGEPIPGTRDGYTPLMVMISKQHFHRAQQFLTHIEGVDVDFQNRGGRTALKMCINAKMAGELSPRQLVILERLIETIQSKTELAKTE